ncbi:MAG: hypothetical protein OJF49_001239 [Ktedonobacterales bacterium]|jgi:putative lipoprotein|nr:MAG: hypothetical protein OJF49_001239 [Ktedonobacterales bacterium]
MAPHPLDATSWRLIAYRVDDDAPHVVPDEIEVTLTFDGMRVAGKSGCNRYMGQVALDATTATFSGMASTRMMCPPPLMEIEDAYLHALEMVRSWERQGDRLELRDDTGNPLLTFAATA